MSRIADAMAKASRGRETEKETVSHPVPWNFTEPSTSAGVERLPVTALAATSAGRPAKFNRRSVQPELGVRLDIDERFRGKLIGEPGLPAGVEEQYRTLAASLVKSTQESPTRVIMVASALPGEGKTLVASNLALTLSGSFGARVLLVDGDLRRPSLHLAFGVPPIRGLTDVMGDETSARPPICALSPTLSLVVAGRPQADPMKIISGSAMHRFVQESALDYDWVILDTPPVGILADASLLADLADRVLLVIRGGSTPYEAVQKAVQQLRRGDNVSAVLNNIDRASEDQTLHDAGGYYGSDVDIDR